MDRLHVLRTRKRPWVIQTREHTMPIAARKNTAIPPLPLFLRVSKVFRVSAYARHFNAAEEILKLIHVEFYFGNFQFWEWKTWVMKISRHKNIPRTMPANFIGAGRAC